MTKGPVIPISERKSANPPNAKGGDVANRSGQEIQLVAIPGLPDREKGRSKQGDGGKAIPDN